MSRFIRRRTVVGGIALLPALFAGLRGARAAGCEAKLGDDGLWHQDWFLESFLVLREDLEEAVAQGKSFAVFWELAGCPYCKETHLVNFARPDICDYVRNNFVVVQLDFVGSRTVTDFDGEELAERDMRAKYAIRFTPTIQFFPDSPEEIDRRLAERGGRAGRHLEVARIQGYMEPDPFLAMFRYVREKAYERTTFEEYLLELLG
ncbi:hypothetical protein HRbin39_01454 [bacterium HR39]|nr:hypothetical protein HRbin39_01454 [bacterium HR39]